MEAFSRIKYVRFDGDNLDEVKTMFSMDAKNKDYTYVFEVFEKDVCIPEWEDWRVTVSVLKIVRYNKNETSLVWCVQGNYVCLDGPDFSNLFILTHKEFVKKYEIDNEEPVTSNNLLFQDCNNCIYKQLYNHPKLPPTPSDPPYPWNQTQIWCKTEGKTK